MSDINWMQKIGWTEDNLEDLRLAGFAYVRQGKYDIALPFFEGLAVLDDHNLYDCQTLGALYLQLGQPDNAIKCFNRALEIEPNNATTLLNMSKALLMVGKVNEGLEIAKVIKADKDKSISNAAKAIILAYSQPPSEIKANEKIG